MKNDYLEIMLGDFNRNKSRIHVKRDNFTCCDISRLQRLKYGKDGIEPPLGDGKFCMRFNNEREIEFWSELHDKPEKGFSGFLIYSDQTGLWNCLKRECEDIFIQMEKEAGREFGYTWQYPYDWIGIMIELNQFKNNITEVMN